MIYAKNKARLTDFFMKFLQLKICLYLIPLFILVACQTTSTTSETIYPPEVESNLTSTSSTDSQSEEPLYPPTDPPMITLPLRTTSSISTTSNTTTSTFNTTLSSNTTPPTPPTTPEQPASIAINIPPTPESIPSQPETTMPPIPPPIIPPAPLTPEEEAQLMAQHNAATKNEKAYYHLRTISLPTKHSYYHDNAIKVQNFLKEKNFEHVIVREASNKKGEKFWVVDVGKFTSDKSPEAKELQTKIRSLKYNNLQQFKYAFFVEYKE